MALLLSQQVEAIKSVLHDKVFEISADALKHHLTESLLTEVRNRTVSILRSFRMERMLPISVSYTAVRVYGYPEEARMEVHLPYRLQLIFTGEAPDQARFKHFTCCRFLAHGLDHDLYYCTEHGRIPTVLARWSDNEQDYESGLYAAQKLNPLESPLALAYVIAQEDGLIPCESWTKMVRTN